MRTKKRPVVNFLVDESGKKEVLLLDEKKKKLNLPFSF